MMLTIRIKWLVVAMFIVLYVIPIPSSQAVLNLDTSLSVSEQYTDNLFFTFANKRDDFGTFITPRVMLEFSNKHITIGGAYSASAQLYVNNPQANTVAHGTNLTLDLPFLNRISKRLEVRINESFNLTPEQPGFSGNSGLFTGSGAASAPGGAGAATAGAGGAGGAGVGGIGGVGGLSGNSLTNQGVFTPRGTTSFQNRARVRIGYNFSPRWDGNVQYSNAFRSGVQDSLSHAIQTSLSFNLTENTRIRGGYSFQIIDFLGGTTSTNAQVSSGGFISDSTSHSLNLGASHQLTETIPVSGRVAVTMTETEASTTRLNFTGRGQISKSFPDGRISLRFNQGIGVGGGLVASSTLNQTVVLTATKSLTRLINAFCHFGYGRNRSLAGLSIDLDSYQARAGVNLSILEWLSGGVTYSYINQESRGQFGNTAQTNQIFVGLTATPQTFAFFR